LLYPRCSPRSTYNGYPVAKVSFHLYNISVGRELIHRSLKGKLTTNMKHITTTTDLKHIEKVDHEHMFQPVLHNAPLQNDTTEHLDAAISFVLDDAGRLVEPVFGYASFGGTIAEKMRAAASVVKKMTQDAHIAVGRALRSLKHEVSHGHSTEWVERECQISICAPKRAVSAALMIEEDDTLSYLHADGVSALASHTAAPVGDDFYRRIEDGEPPSAADIGLETKQAKLDAEGAKPTVQQRDAFDGLPAEEEQPEKSAEIERQATVKAANAKLAAILLDRLDDNMDEAIVLLNDVERWTIGDALREALVGRREAKAVVPVDPEEPPLPFSAPRRPADATFSNGLVH
jgi:hypothetical protein